MPLLTARLPTAAAVKRCTVNNALVCTFFKENLTRRPFICMTIKKIIPAWFPSVLLLLLFLVAPRPSRAFTLADLQNDPTLTPGRLIQKFARFKFHLFQQLQPRGQFLATETGDCYDFASLAADVLRARGYTTRLIAVFMARQTHVVCYVKEARAYLDYNNRAKADPLVSSDGALADVAAKVARSFHSTWFNALEFTLRNGVRQPVKTAFPGV